MESPNDLNALKFHELGQNNWGLTKFIDLLNQDEKLFVDFSRDLP